MATTLRVHRPGALFPLRIEQAAQRLRVFVPRSLYVKKGLLLLCALLPLLCVLTFLLFGTLVGEENAAAEPVFAAGFFFMSSASALAGLVMIGASGALSRRWDTTLDRATGQITTPRAPYPIPSDAVHGVRVSRGKGLSDWATIALVDASGRPLVVLHDRLASGHARDTAWVASTRATFLGLPGPAPSHAIAGPFGSTSENQAAALCYLPIEGIFVFASVYYLLSARNRPSVRFAAIQSLAQLAASIVVLFVILVAGGVPVALLPDGIARWVAVAVLAALLVAFFVWNVVARIVATARAYRGRTWIMPWLAPLVRRCAPPAERRNSSV